MTVRSLRALEIRSLDDGRIDAKDAEGLVDAVNDNGGVNLTERRAIGELLLRNADRMDPEAKATLQALIADPPAEPRATPFELRLGNRADRLEDDTVILGGTDTLDGTSGVKPFTRGYDSMKDGVLRFQHGTVAPESKVLNATELSALRAQSPGVSLDKAAALYGVKDAGFERMANSKDFYDPQAAYWWGKCHAWGWASLDNWVNSRVDVDGPPGQQGLWLGGQWLSRADLGNWMMGTADKISLNSGSAINDTHVTAEDLLVAMRQFMTDDGGGVVADIWNDKKKGHLEVWNQPFVGAQMTSKNVSAEAEKAILDIAKNEGVTGGASVKWVDAVGKYGTEASDDHEGPPTYGEQKWNIYVVSDENGKMVKAYEADHPLLQPIRTKLPTVQTADLPDYFWKPHLGAIADILKGRSNPVVDNDVNGKQFKFFVEKTLGLGVPGATRAQFEAAVEKLPSGQISPATAQELATDYAGVANAYSPAQWTQFFGSRGLDSASFGAAWAPAPALS